MSGWLKNMYFIWLMTDFLNLLHLFLSVSLKRLSRVHSKIYFAGHHSKCVTILSHWFIHHYFFAHLSSTRYWVRLPVSAHIGRGRLIAWSNLQSVTGTQGNIQTEYLIYMDKLETHLTCMSVHAEAYMCIYLDRQIMSHVTPVLIQLFYILLLLCI